MYVMSVSRAFIYIYIRLCTYMYVFPVYTQEKIYCEYNLSVYYIYSIFVFVFV